MRHIQRVERHRVAQTHAIGRLRHRPRPQDGHALGLADFGALGVHQVQAALARVQFHPRILNVRIPRENRRQRAHLAGPLVLIQHQALDGPHRFYRPGMSEIVELLVLLHVAHGRPFARDGFHRRFVGRIRHQPEITPQQRVGVLQRKPLQIVTRPAEAAAGKVAVVEFVIAHAHLHVRRAEAFGAPGKQPAQRGRQGVTLLLIDHVLDEVRRFQVG